MYFSTMKPTAITVDESKNDVKVGDQTEVEVPAVSIISMPQEFESAAPNVSPIITQPVRNTKFYRSITPKP